MSTETIETPSSLGTRQAEELVAAWRSGERPRAEDILARHPELGEDAAIRLLYEEACLRLEAGLEVDPSEVAGRFPRWRDELEALLDCRRLMESAPARAIFPAVGELLAGFRLLGELGRGAAGRVYLAVQPSLGDRPVVLKVAPLGRDEHLSLARLQHMNIVPLFSEHVLRDRNLRALCMPYLGGTTLARVLEALGDVAPSRRTGGQILEAIDRLQARGGDGPRASGPLRRFLARAGYVEAIVVIGAALADGLHYAHQRELVHMDVKPSNVLLAADGQPMLLDFHLARGPIEPAGPPLEWMGGTLAFMAPEQRRAMAAVREGRPVVEPVDGRADVYALGMLLSVALGGRPPGAGDAPVEPLHRLNPRVSVGLSDVVRRSLCDDQRDRYPDAASLAEDLRRHLADLPLRGVANRSWPERWRKWRRRHAGAISGRGAAALVLIAAIGAPAATLAMGHRQRRDAVRAALAAGRVAISHRRYAEAAEAFRLGLARIEGLPLFARRRRELAEALDLATRAARIAELHDLAEDIRFRYGLAPPPPEVAPALIRLGRKAWDSRDSLLRGLDDLGDPEADRRARADLHDLVLLWADLSVRYADPAHRDRAAREASRLRAEAASFLEAGSRERGSGRSSGEPRSAWEHYDLGRSYLRSGDLGRAAESFRNGLKLRPQDFWLNFYDGLCAYRFGRYDEAVAAFRVCIALAPDSAPCYYNRGLAYQSLGQFRPALDDYDRALALNPRLKDAERNRGIVRARLAR